MGTDIHTFVEKKVNGTWQAVAGPNPYEWEREEKPEAYEGWIYDDRNYILFGFLAGVRDYKIEPLSTPRGIPGDVSDVVKDCMDDDYDLHSRSYFTLKELEEADLNKTLSITRMVSVEAKRNYLENGTLPTTWCSRTNSDGWSELTWQVSYGEEIGDTINSIVNKLKEVAGDLDHNDVRFVFAFDN